MGQEEFLSGVALERRPYAHPDQAGLRAWRSRSRNAVVQGFGDSPPQGGVFSAPGSVDDWEEISPPHEWDHDHCEFCGARFMDQATRREEEEEDSEVLSEGYVTVEAECDRWICAECFADFKDEFAWTVRGV
jgi:hypothetical protein